MSLEKLLQDAGDSAAWKLQRRLLVRIILGIGISAAALTAGVVALISTRHHGAIARSVATPATGAEPDSQTLTQLMRMRNEADALKNQITELRRPAAETEPRAAAIAPVRTAHARGVVSYDPGEGFAALEKDKEDLYLPTGTVFQAQLITPIKTSVAKTFVMAEVTHEYRMDQKRKIEKGSRLIGISHLNPVLKGVIVEFDKLVTPKGIETSVAGLAMSRNALPEIEGMFFSDKLVNYGTALAFGFLSGFADAAREREYTILGSQPTVSVSNDVLTGFSTASFQIADEVLRDVRSSAVEYVVVPAAEQIFVALTRKYDVNQGGKK